MASKSTFIFCVLGFPISRSQSCRTMGTTPPPKGDSGPALSARGSPNTEQNCLDHLRPIWEIDISNLFADYAEIFLIPSRTGRTRDQTEGSGRSGGNRSRKPHSLYRPTFRDRPLQFAPVQIAAPRCYSLAVLVVNTRPMVQAVPER